MNINPTSSHRNLPVGGAGGAGRSEHGLTLIEMMVSTVCLLIIILGLTAMFIQTQKAFKTGLRQNDTSDNGRTIADLLVRDLSQMASAQNTNVTNSVFTVRADRPLIIQNNADGLTPIRTNFVEDIFTITRVGSAWASIGYAVSLSTNTIVGTLYRYAPPPLTGSPTNRPPPISPEGLNAFNAQYNIFTSTNWMIDRVADGIIHLQVHAYDTNGFEIPPVMNGTVVSLPFPGMGTGSIIILPFPYVSPTNSAVTFNLPAALELELGVLEPEALEHVRALGNITAQLSYLSNHAGQVQIFRQQIPIKAATR